ncbi:uncharacterized protein ATNIH1004_006679 [Aspergillus tanneri]|uniref:Major facilitator superfamily (MFS) profile domain-containing protein n=1 Tax=Aspergillus tanneri TaxID=1220188 RepID=A0A5M9MIT5_9EURO|nr:uncharacterized protein ATNIH1004_006679 [Aspergillus tanneri]KAA8645260.1 hypothetical protein ATNIH1004_006679 [Aspergillus tanneri]
MPVAPEGGQSSNQPPGTVRWFPSLIEPGNKWAQCKYRLWTGKSNRQQRTGNEAFIDNHIELSPNYPLNWPARRRDAVLVAVGLYSLIAGGLIPVLAAGFTDISRSFNVSLRFASFTTGTYVLGLGIGAIILSPTATQYGERLVYLVGISLLTCSTASAAASQRYTSLSLSRLIQGIGASPGEFMVSATITEIYYPHERAYRLGIYMLLISTGKSLSPLFGAALIQLRGRRWAMWEATIIATLCFLLIFLLARETFWVEGCPTYLPAQDRGGVSGQAMSNDPIINNAQELTGRNDSSPQGSELHISSIAPGQLYTNRLRKSPPLFTHTLYPWNGRLHHENWLRLAINPVYLLKSPPVLWSAVAYAFSMGWLIVLAESVGYLFQSPDRYAFSPVQTGLLYISPLVGATLGSAIGGKTSDMLACVQAYRNKGIYEPEFRLLMGIPAALSTSIGLVAFGETV